MTDLFGQKDDILEQQIRCVEREIGMRQRVYPNWINAKKMSAGKAEYEIQMMQEVLKSLKQNAELKETNEALNAELKEVCDVLIRKCPEMKEWVMMNWKNLYEVDNAR